MSTKTRAHHHASQTSSAEATRGPTEKPAPALPKACDEQRYQLIERRAYELWEEAGKPHGDAIRERLWCEAEQEIMAIHAMNA